MEKFTHLFFLRFLQLFRAIGRAATDFLLPPLCLKCDAPVARDQTLCPTCWKSVHFISPPRCALCGAPFDLPVSEGTLCADCLSAPLAFDGARSALLYDEASKDLILRFKHADRVATAPALAAWMARAGAEFLENADLIAPVPLHRWRLLRRRYNQSALLARVIAKKAGKKLAVDLLYRTRATDSQGHKNRKERKENVKNAFALNRAWDIEGKTIVLIDDVMTSGATLDACAEALKKNGAKRVYAVTLARTRIAT